MTGLPPWQQPPAIVERASIEAAQRARAAIEAVEEEGRRRIAAQRQQEAQQAADAGRRGWTNQR